jgi:hypothetical protein
VKSGEDEEKQGKRDKGEAEAGPRGCNAWRQPTAWAGDAGEAEGLARGPGGGVEEEGGNERKTREETRAATEGFFFFAVAGPSNM